MYSDATAILLSATLLVTVVAALLAKKVSISLILLFYSSLILGVIFTLYDDVIVGLVTMITFAGAISVLILSVVLMTGESSIGTATRRTQLAVIAVGALVVAVAAYAVFAAAPGGSPSSAGDISLQLLTFIWQFRPWDLLILVMVFAASMLSVTNLLSEEGE